MNIPILIHKDIGKGSSQNLGIEEINNTEVSCLCARDYKGISRMRANAVIVGEVEPMIEYLKIKEANNKGYAEAYEGDGVNLGASGSHTRRGRVNKGGVNTLTTQSEMGAVVKGLRIRKLTPKECWRLQGWGFVREDGSWDDTAFEKAKWEKETIFFEGGEYGCDVKLKTVSEKPKLSDMEIYVSCTINDMFDMEMLTMMDQNNISKQEQEKMQSANIAIEKSAGLGVSECATSITKYIDYMGMPCTVIINPEVHQVTDIIVQASVGKGNTVKCMRITTESNLNATKLFIILTLLKLITELKIFTSTTAKANIQWLTQNIEGLENCTMLKVSDLRMEHIEQRVSDSELYKQAGNGCSANITEVIGLRLAEIENTERGEEECDLDKN